MSLAMTSITSRSGGAKSTATGTLTLPSIFGLMTTSRTNAQTFPAPLTCPAGQPNPGSHPDDGTNKNFQIADGNVDSTWTVSYSGDSITTVHMNGISTGEFAMDNSERHATADNLYAHFNNVQVCTVQSGGCAGHFHNPNAYQDLYDDAPDYHWCKVSATNHWVLASGDTC
jgi:hypothetical protein